MTDPRFPIGPAPQITSLSPQERHEGISALRQLPDEFAAALAGLTDAQLDTPYREGGWTLRQVAHHVPDSHMNAYIRTKLALTETEPTIKPYEEHLWAELPDSRLDVAVSLELLRALHTRWVALFESLAEADWERKFVHPQLLAAQQQGDWARAFKADEAGRLNLDQLLSTYVWHGRHHTAHILNLRRGRGW